MEKKKYYVSLQAGEISQIKYDNNDEFLIYATDEEIDELRSKINQMDDAAFGTFLRAHIPIKPYHEDPQNDDYDAGITEAFQMLYQLGDENTKSHIESIGILSNRHM
ncbi:hydrolase [Ornithinibacillus sp. L9]|uniref:Hydrolase n=1 Tax=Ornithinibacillus caprae TaxID=2678566 RepID=A0A6N8FK68_9BACI|nr:hydrolase [Ornithinibacillus caprae]MUK90052.1 hydrolase [Ornithinibacillus caprae]